MTPAIGVTVPEAMALLHLGRTRIYELINAGTLRSVLIGKRRLILRSSIDTLFAEAA